MVSSNKRQHPHARPNDRACIFAGVFGLAVFAPQAIEKSWPVCYNKLYRAVRFLTVPRRKLLCQTGFLKKGKLRAAGAKTPE